MAEKHTVYFVLKKNRRTNVLLKQSFALLKEYQPFISRKPIPPYDSKPKPTSPSELPIDNPDTAIYSVGYNMRNSGFGFTFNRNLVVVDQIFDIGEFEKDEAILRIEAILRLQYSGGLRV